PPQRCRVLRARHPLFAQADAVEQTAELRAVLEVPGMVFEGFGQAEAVEVICKLGNARAGTADDEGGGEHEDVRDAAVNADRGIPTVAGTLACPEDLNVHGVSILDRDRGVIPSRTRSNIVGKKGNVIQSSDSCSR